jgi:RNA polymerase sigma factor (sigma-70 family)
MTADDVYLGSDREDSADVASASDEDLLALMVGKENPPLARAAGAEFYSRHIAWLYAVCHRAYHRLLGREGVEDLVQETFRRVFSSGAATYKSAPLDETEARLRRIQGWMTTIARRLACDLLRGCRRHGEIQLEPDEWQDVPEPEQGPASEEAVRVGRVMQEVLNAREQDVLRTTYQWYDPARTHQKLPETVLADLARRWGTTSENIRQIRARALRKIKDALGSDPAHPADER